MGSQDTDLRILRDMPSRACDLRKREEGIMLIILSTGY